MTLAVFRRCRSQQVLAACSQELVTNKPERALHHYCSGVETPPLCIKLSSLKGFCWFCGFIDYDDGAAAMVTTAAGNGGGGEGEGGMGEEGFGSGEWIGEGVNEATFASLNNTMTTKPAPHKATASGLMLADEDKAMTMKPAPHKAAVSGQTPANNEAMTKKPAPHEAAAKCQPTRTRQQQQSLPPTRPPRVAKCRPTRTSH